MKQIILVMYLPNLSVHSCNQGYFKQRQPVRKRWQDLSLQITFFKKIF